MARSQPVLLSVGEKYPFKIPQTEGAISDFLRPGGNRLLIAIPGISNEESKVLRKHEMRGGLLVKNRAILFVWQFRKKDEPIITLDSPFNARLIPDIQFHDVENTETRLLIEVHIIDSKTGIVCGLRSITMPPKMTIDFLSAVQDQIVGIDSNETQHQNWMKRQPHELAQKTQMWLMGK